MAAVSADRSKEEQWRGVVPAYEWVRPSYELVERRSEAIANRLRAFLTVVVSLTFGAPVFAKAALESVDFRSPWFVLALIVGALAGVLCVGAQVWGKLIVLDLKGMYEKTLQLSEWEFKLNCIENAVDHFDKNLKRVNFKGYTADAVGGLVLVETAVLIIWIITTARP